MFFGIKIHACRRQSFIWLLLFLLSTKCVLLLQFWPVSYNQMIYSNFSRCDLRDIWIEAVAAGINFVWITLYLVFPPFFELYVCQEIFRNFAFYHSCIVCEHCDLSPHGYYASNANCLLWMWILCMGIRVLISHINYVHLFFGKIISNSFLHINYRYITAINCCSCSTTATTVSVGIKCHRSSWRNNHLFCRCRSCLHRRNSQSA